MGEFNAQNGPERLRNLGRWPDNNILQNSGKDRVSDCVIENMKNVNTTLDV
jgi:hypothetical protein